MGRGTRSGARGSGRRATSSLAVVALALTAAPTTASAAGPDDADVLALDRATAAAVDRLDDAVDPDDAGPGDVLADRLLVTWQPGTSAAEAAATLDDLDLDGDLVDGFSVGVVHVAPDAAADALVALATEPTVVRVTPDEAFEVRTAAAPPPEQWGLENTGQEILGQTGRRSMDTGATAAWPAGRGRSDVVVAIVDTGIDTTHPDLAANLWRNPDEDGGLPGVDDDRNGFVDDIHGYDFVNDRGEVYDPADPRIDRHGTHVAGIVAAVDDDAGVVGVAPRVRVMSVKTLEREQGRASDTIRGIQYAADNGADVINASFGIVARPGSEFVQDLADTIVEARVPVVAAAGNTGTDLARTAMPEYPAALPVPNVIAVAAHDNRGRVPVFSNRSTSLVDVAAPGVGVYSTDTRGGYRYLTGTSQAAPHVSGILALAVSHTGVRDGAALGRALRAGARPFGPLAETAADDGSVRPSSVTRAGIASGPGLLLALDADLGACRGGVPRAAFPDVDRADVHTPAIDCLVRHGLADGFPDGTYRPSGRVTRGQVASFLGRLLATAREVPVPTAGRFTDVIGSPHRDNVEALAALGVIDGFGDGTFRPSEPVTRDQFASLLVRTYELAAAGRVRPTGGGFPDAVGSAHEEAVRTGAHLGFVQGRVDGRFAPRSEVTRAQMASFLRRTLDKLVADRAATLP